MAEKQLKRGDRVNYWNGFKEGEPSGQGEIKHFGEIGGVKVAWVRGASSCVAITHLEAVKG